MLIKMLKPTFYKGVKRVGNSYEVDSIVANRWINNGIAMEIVEDKVVKNIKPIILDKCTFDGVQKENVSENSDIKEPVDYDSMTAKELYFECKNKGLRMKPKLDREEYIEALINNDKGE